MTNVFFWGFTKELAPAVRFLKKENLCNVVVWVGSDNDCTHSRSAFVDISGFKYNTSLLCDEKIHEAVFSSYYRYLDRVQTHNRYNQNSIYEYLNLFNRQINYFYYLLKSSEVEIIFFPRMPHYGPDTLLWLLAKAMGIRTVALFTFTFPNQFFYVYNLEDFGYFKEIPGSDVCSPVKVERIFKKSTPPWLREAKKYTYSWMDLAKDIFLKKWNALSKYKNYKQFQRNLKALIQPEFSWADNFIYFPLHFQPEMTTSTIGNQYVDQMLALERLSSILPEGWYIYTKEHRMQTEFMRGPLFYERMRALSNVKLLPPETDTYLLLEKCCFAATITGSVGWEAISGGKNVLVFGQPWYLTLPGVFQYCAQFNINEILDFVINHDELELALARLFSKTQKGIIAFSLYDVKNFDAEENGQILGQSLANIIQESARLPPL